MLSRPSIWICNPPWTTKVEEASWRNRHDQTRPPPVYSFPWKTHCVNHSWEAKIKWLIKMVTGTLHHDLLTDLSVLQQHCYSQASSWGALLQLQVFCGGLWINAPLGQTSQCKTTQALYYTGLGKWHQPTWQEETWWRALSCLPFSNGYCKCSEMGWCWRYLVTCLSRWTLGWILMLLDFDCSIF